MNTQEFIKAAIENNEDLSVNAKHAMSAEVDRNFNFAKEDRDLIDAIRKVAFYKRERIEEIYKISNQHVVYLQIANGEKSYFTFDILNNQRLMQSSDNLDNQILITLGIKYLGSNTQFGGFASSMLGINEAGI